MSLVPWVDLPSSCNCFLFHPWNPSISLNQYFPDKGSETGATGWINMGLFNLCIGFSLWVLGFFLSSLKIWLTPLLPLLWGYQNLSLSCGKYLTLIAKVCLINCYTVSQELKFFVIPVLLYGKIAWINNLYINVTNIYIDLHDSI